MRCSQLRIVGRLMMAVVMAAVLMSCSGGGGDSSSDTGATSDTGAATDTGSLTLNITDAPVDDASNVVVMFTGVELHAASGEEHYYGFDEPQTLDLLALQDGASVVLWEEAVPVGHYTWIRLEVMAERGVLDDSYIITLDGDKYSLWIPSGEQSGLKLNRAFDVSEEGVLEFMIDFDLRKSVHRPVGMDIDYILRPTLRIMETAVTGNVTGMVASELLADPLLADPCTGGDVVYVFEGPDVTPDDIDDEDPNPITTASVTLDVNTGEYVYTVAYLSAGEYTLALTCQADSDYPESDDSAEVGFVATTNVTVTSGMTTTYDFVK